MARPLPLNLDKATVSGQRRPAFQVLVYDVRSTTDTMREVVQQSQPLPPPLQALTGPRDFTAEVESVDVSEVAGDYASNGIGVSTLKMKVIDGRGIFDPQLAVDDPEGDGRWLRRRNIVVVREGDARVPISEWPITFTGKFIGQAGVVRSRAVGPKGQSTISLNAVDRAPDFLKHPSISNDFAVGTTLLNMALDVAQNDMGLDLTEIDFSGFGTLATGLPITFVEEPPLVTLAKIMFVDGFTPRFRGDGVLTGKQAEITKSPERIYDDQIPHTAIVTPEANINPVDTVRVVGISPVLSRIDQKRQQLADLEITTGYFTSDEKIPVRWSEDATQLADLIELKVEKSVNGGLSILGGGEDLIVTPAQGGVGSVGGFVEIETGFAPYVIIFLTVAYIVLAVIPDAVLGFIGGSTISVGRLIQATALALVLLLMSKIGRGSYRFLGCPFEFVYEELTGIAKADFVAFGEEDELEIKNHLCQSQTIVDTQARDVLFRQQAKGNPRQVTMHHDLKIEPDDVFEIPGGRRFLVESITRKLQRGPEPVVATLSVSETTPGLFL